MAKRAVTEAGVSFIESLKQKVERNPGDPDVHRQLGLGFLGAGELDQAFDVLEAARGRFSQNPEILYALALVLKKRGDLERARTLFREVIALGSDLPDSPRYSMLLSMALSQDEIIASDR